MIVFELNYDIVVTNNTNSPAESIDVVIEDRLNSNFSFVKAEIIGGLAATPSYENGLLTCDIGTIGIGESRTLTVTVIKDYNAKGVVVVVENTNNSSLDIAISLIDHTKVSAQVFTRIIILDSKSRKSFIIG